MFVLYLTPPKVAGRWAVSPEGILRSLVAETSTFVDGLKTRSPVSLATIFVLKDKSSILTLPVPVLTNFKSASDTFVLIVLFSNVKILTFAFCVCTSFHLSVEVPRSPAPAKNDEPGVKPRCVQPFVFASMNLSPCAWDT